MVKNTDIVKLRMTEQAFLDACERWNKMPKTNLKKIFTESSEKTLCGFAAEEFIHKNLMPEIIPSLGEEVYDFDYYFFGKKMEIKNKCVNSIPTAAYEASTYTYHDPECDFFLFTRMKSEHRNDCLPRGFGLKDEITSDMSKELSKKLLLKYPNIYLLGVIERFDFYSKRYKVTKGSELQYGAIAKGETWNVKISELHPVRVILNYYNDKFRKTA